MLQELDSDNDEAEGNPCVGKRGVRSFLWPLCFIGRIGEMRSEARAAKHRDMATHLDTRPSNSVDICRDGAGAARRRVSGHTGAVLPTPASFSDVGRARLCGTALSAA